MGRTAEHGEIGGIGDRGSAWDRGCGDSLWGT